MFETRPSSEHLPFFSIPSCHFLNGSKLSVHKLVISSLHLANYLPVLLLHLTRYFGNQLCLPIVLCFSNMICPISFNLLAITTTSNLTHPFDADHTLLHASLSGPSVFWLTTMSELCIYGKAVKNSSLDI